MGTGDVRIDPKLNQALWERGIKSVPHRIRVKLERESCFLHPQSRRRSGYPWRSVEVTGCCRMQLSLLPCLVYLIDTTFHRETQR